MSQSQGRIVAVLGPTNTGKTHYAIERMLAHRSGMIGLPLRLLAREVYDRIVAIRGPSVVALVTGEERIVPERTKYWICTVEAMPEGMGVDFLAVDEIQLCADPERGHVFTDRLLRARGLHETLFLGSDTMRSAIAALEPKAQFTRRERFSELTYTGPKKISRMPPRAAIVGFSVDNVYAIAELLRRQKGGAAVVMGALSPRTRNAQVEMYQNGEVDYLVATDAIGMGLNLDITHVAFSGLRKFDGRRMRQLQPNELAQIAGRAGRYMTAGTFGVTGEAPPLQDDVVNAITSHSFTPMKKLQWRNSRLEFGSIDRLIATLETGANDEWLVRAREADDLMVLKSLSEEAEVRARASDGKSVKLLWDVCRIPDFRGISHQEHAHLLETIFGFLHEDGEVSEDWLAQKINRIDRTDGDIDALSKRLAYIRTWTYVAQRNGWCRDESHWRDATRAVEDRLSDALHTALTQRFVDRRTSVLLRRLKQKEGLVAKVNDKGEVTVEDQFIGRIEGFRFHQDATATGDEAKTVRAAAIQALQPEFHLRADRFYNAPDTEMDFTEQGGLMWGEHAIGKLVAGDDALKPRAHAFVDDEAGPDVAEKVQRRLQHFIDRKVAALFEPLMNIQRDETLTGLARGFGFRMVENFGVVDRRDVADDVKALDQDSRSVLRKHGVRFGQFTIFMPLLLKPAPTRLRLVLWALANNLDEFPESPPPGLVTIPTAKGTPANHALMAGYKVGGDRSIRIDMLERLADMLRKEDSRSGFEANSDMLSITGMTLEQFANLMEGLGYSATRGTRDKPAPVDAVIPEAAATPADPDTPVMDQGGEATGEAAGAVTQTPETPEPADVPDGTEMLIDEGRAPIDETQQSADTTEEAAAEGAPPAETSDTEVPTGTAADAVVEADRTEVFYTFAWAGNRGRQQDKQPQQQQRQGGRPQGNAQGKPGGKPKGKGKPRGQDGGNKPRKFEARPPRKEKAIDPDNPFAAALMGFAKKDK